MSDCSSQHFMTIIILCTFSLANVCGHCFGGRELTWQESGSQRKRLKTTAPHHADIKTSQTIEASQFSQHTLTKHRQARATRSNDSCERRRKVRAARRKRRHTHYVVSPSPPSDTRQRLLTGRFLVGLNLFSQGTSFM